MSDSLPTLIGAGLFGAFCLVRLFQQRRQLLHMFTGAQPTWVNTRRGQTGNLPVIIQERTVIGQLAIDAVTMRYRQTIIGWPWLILRPLVAAVGITFVFSSIIGVKSGSSAPYFLFALIGQMVWGVLRMGMVMATRSLRRTQSIHKGIQIPPFVAVSAFCAPAVLDMLVGLVITVVATVAYRIIDGKWYVLPRWELLLLPVAIFLILLITIGVGQWTAVLSRTYRDIRIAMGSFMSLWSFLTPVMYPATAVPPELRWTLSWNPAAFPVILGREALIGDQGLTWSIAVNGLVGIGILLFLGSFAKYFDKGKRRPGDFLEEDDDDELI